MEQFSKGEECISHFQKKEKIRRIAFFLLFSFLFSIHGRIMRNPYTKKRNNRLLMRNIGQKVSKITRNSREIRWHACTQKKKPKKNIEKTRERERGRKGRKGGGEKIGGKKKLNVSPSAYKQIERFFCIGSDTSVAHTIWDRIYIRASILRAATAICQRSE